MLLTKTAPKKIDEHYPLRATAGQEGFITDRRQIERLCNNLKSGPWRAPPPITLCGQRVLLCQNPRYPPTCCPYSTYRPFRHSNMLPMLQQDRLRLALRNTFHPLMAPKKGLYTPSMISSWYNSESPLALRFPTVRANMPNYSIFSTPWPGATFSSELFWLRN